MVGVVATGSELDDSSWAGKAVYGGGSTGISKVLATPPGYVNETGLEDGEEADPGDDALSAAPVLLPGPGL